MLIKLKQNKRGSLILEVLIAVSIFAVVASSLTALVLQSFTTSSQGSERTQALAYAKECMEAVKAIRERGWFNLENGAHGLQNTSGYWEFYDTSDSLDGIFLRTATISDVERDGSGNIVQSGGTVDPNTKQGVCNVSWTNILGQSNSINLTGLYMNWESKGWTQTDWSGGSGQAIWSDTTMFNTSSNIKHSTAGQIELSSAGGGSGYYDWPFTTAGDYTYNASKIDVAGGAAQLHSSGPTNWWDSNYNYRQQITITNNSTSSLPAGYSTNVSFDHYALVQASKSLASGNDVRIVYWNGSTNTELDRYNETVWNTNGTNTQLWFKTQAAIAGSGTDNNYYIYYNYSGAGTPPADQNSVYAFFDGFENNNLDNWTNQVNAWKNPAITGQYNTANSSNVANDVFVVGTTAYVVNNADSGAGAELYIINISTPSTPTLLGSLNLGVTANAIYISGNYAYIATASNSQEMMVVNISNPASLSINGSYNTSGYTGNANDVFISGNYAYLATSSNGNTAPEFFILNITTPNSPTLVGSYSVATNNILAVYVSGNYAYITESDNSAELRVLNITNPASISSAGVYNASGNGDGTDVYVVGTNAYLTRNYSATAGQYEFLILNVATPGSISLTGYSDFTANANTVFVPVGLSYAYVGTSVASNQFTVIDITTPASPSTYSTLSTTSDANGIYMLNDTVYLATSDSANEFKIIDKQEFWTVATDQKYAGTYAMKTNLTTATNQWITANGLSDTDLLVESYWRFSSTSDNISQGQRSSSSLPINEYETTMEGTAGWDIAKEIAGTWTEIATNAGTPAANTWTKITSIVEGTNMKVQKDGTQIVPSSGSTAIGSQLTSGTIGFRANTISSGNWWIDNVKARKYRTPEPTTSQGTETPRVSYPTDSPTIYPTNSYPVTGVTSWDSFVETATKSSNYYLDEDQTGFDTGTYSNTQWSALNWWLELTAAGKTAGSGTYTSAIKDAGASTSWTNISWVPVAPYEKEMPNSGATETAYSEGNLDMSGNKVLLHLNESSGTISDSSGNGYTGTYNGSLYSQTGKLKTAIGFNGTSNYIAMSTPLSTWMGTTASLAFWIKTSQAGSDSAWLAPGVTGSEENGGTNDIFWGYITASGKIRIQAGNTAGATSTTTINNGAWHHVVLTRDSTSGETKVYVDGTLENTATSDTGTKSTAFSDIGRIYDTGGTPMYLNGTLDEVAIWNSVIDATMVANIYKRGALRIRYQVRSCNDAACSGESFIGPDGTTATYYTEANNSAISLPSFALTNISDNRYFQYRATLQTDNTSLTPEVKSITYSKGGGYSNIFYQLSYNNGSTWMFWNGASWVAASGATDYNPASTVNSHIAVFPTTNSQIKFKAFLVSDGTTQAQLDNIHITYSAPSGYATSGTLESSAFNTSSDATLYSVLHWLQTAYAGGSIKVQIKTAPDNGGSPGTWTATWCGPEGDDGDETDFFTDSNGTAIHADQSNQRWIKYLITFDGDGAGTPVMQDITVNYR